MRHEIILPPIRLLIHRNKEIRDNFLYSIVLGAIISFVNLPLIAQKQYKGFYGKKTFISFQAGILPPYSDYQRLDEHNRIDIKRSIIKPKIGAMIGLMSSSRTQVCLGALIYKPSDIAISNFQTRSTYMSNIVVRDTSSATMSSINYQIYFEYHRYSFLAPIGFHTVFGLGISLTPYSYQYSLIEYTTDHLANTYSRTEKNFGPQYKNILTPFFSVRFGKSFAISKSNTIDFGVKNTLFIKRNKSTGVAEKMTTDNISYTFRKLSVREKSINNLIEFYAVYNLRF